MYPDGEYRLYVSNLAPDVREPDLRLAFAAYRSIRNVVVISTAVSGRGRTFAFIEMTKARDFLDALQKADGLVLKGRAIRVTKAKDKDIQKSKIMDKNLWDTEGNEGKDEGKDEGKEEGKEEVEKKVKRRKNNFKGEKIDL